MKQIKDEINFFLKETYNKFNNNIEWDSFYEDYKHLLPHFPDGEYKKNFMKFLYETSSIPSAENECICVSFYKKDCELLKKIKFENQDNYEDLLLEMAALMFWKKAHPHENGWIKYEPCLIFDSIKDKIKDNFQNLTLDNLLKYGFDMRVIGSKKPIVCYTVPTSDDSDDEKAIDVKENEIYLLLNYIKTIGE